MRRPNVLSPLLAILATALACGGGGGSGSGGGGGTAEITSENADDITIDVMDAIGRTANLGSIGAFATGVVPESSGTADAGDASRRSLATAVRLALEVAREPLPSLPGGGIRPSVAFDPITQPCEGGGFVTVAGDVAGEIPAAGDRITARFDACGSGEDRVDGVLSFTVLGFSGDPEVLYSIALDLDLEELALGTGAERVELDGDALTIFNNTVPPLVLSSAQGERLRYRFGEGDDAYTLTVRDYEALLSEDAGEEEYEIEADGEVSGSAFTGQVAYDVTQTLNGDFDRPDDDDEDPEPPKAGIVLVTGDASAMQIAPVTEDDVTIVQLRLDLDDDGDFEQTIPTTWEDLGF